MTSPTTGISIEPRNDPPSFTQETLSSFSNPLHHLIPAFPSPFMPPLNSARFPVSNTTYPLDPLSQLNYLRNSPPNDSSTTTIPNSTPFSDYYIRTGHTPTPPITSGIPTHSSQSTAAKGSLSKPPLNLRTSHSNSSAQPENPNGLIQQLQNTIAKKDQLITFLKQQLKKTQADNLELKNSSLSKKIPHYSPSESRIYSLLFQKHNEVLKKNTEALKNLKKKYASLKKDYKNLDKDLVTAEEEIKELKNKIEKVNKEKTRLEYELAAKDDLAVQNNGLSDDEISVDEDVE